MLAYPSGVWHLVRKSLSFSMMMACITYSSLRRHSLSTAKKARRMAVATVDRLANKDRCMLIPRQGVALRFIRVDLKIFRLCFVTVLKQMCVRALFFCCCVRALFFYCCCVAVACELFDVDDSVPWLRSKGTVVAFDSGWDSFVVADSSCVRINSRGVQTKPSHWDPVPASELSGPWSRVECAYGQAALCLLGSTGGGSVLPSASRGYPPAYNPAFAWGGLECHRAYDGRWLDGSAPVYDVSSCDVLDGGGDLALCGRDLYYGRSGLPVGSYCAVCVIAVFVVRSLSYLVVRKISPGSSTGESKTYLWQDALTVVVCLAVLPLCLVPWGSLWFITREEAFFFVFSCCYVGMYAVIFAVHAWYGTQNDPPIYNLIAGTLQIIASRLYLSSETPYNPVIIWAIGTRALVKARAGKDQRLYVGVSTLVDSLYLSLLCVLGFQHDPRFLVVIFGLSLATSDILT